MVVKEDSPAIFISYAWSSVTNENWIVEFATRLFHSGVVVKLDKWDLVPGHDKYAFMEQMVHDEKIKYVLIICDSVYQEKANSRSGGVGTETQIISKEVYSSVDQTKFVPILREFDLNGNPCLPTYLGSRIYIDFSKDELIEESFEKLLRIIFDRPSIKRPELGVPPAYIFDSELHSNKSNSIQRQAIYAIKNEKPFGAALINQYLQEVLNSLDEFSISYSSGDETYDEKVVDSIRKMNGLRDDFIELMDVISTYNRSFDFEPVLDFFSNLNIYFNARKYGVGYNSLDFDNFKFLGRDLIISLISILLKNGLYKAIEEIIFGPYFPKDALRRAHEEPETCAFLNHYFDSFEQLRKKRLGSNLISLAADFSRENVSKHLKFGELIIAEAVVFNSTLLNSSRPSFGRDWWYPMFSPYVDQQVDVSFFTKMVSIKHFEKVKCVFRVKERRELVDKIKSTVDYLREKNFNFGYYSNPPLIQSFIDPEKIATR